VSTFRQRMAATVIYHLEEAALVEEEVTHLPRLRPLISCVAALMLPFPFIHSLMPFWRQLQCARAEICRSCHLLFVLAAM
jgi:hypothetical protein